MNTNAFDGSSSVQIGGSVAGNDGELTRYSRKTNLRDAPLTAFRETAHSHLVALFEDDAVEQRASLALAPDVDWHVSAPVEQLLGRAAVIDGFLKPIRAALTQARRRDEIFIGGDNIRDEGGQWVASVCHYVGNFDAPLWGIAPSHHLVFLRCGEFYRIEGGQITKARIIVDLPDLMRQAGRTPWPQPYGTEMLFPGPATHDGVLPNGTRGPQSIGVVERMFAGLHVFDPETMGSDGQTGAGGTWDDQMLWYGPTGIGSNYLWSGFVKDHRQSFLDAFPDRKGGNHYCRIGDSDYGAVSGWPSMTMTFQGDYLDVKADGRPLTLRVMDFYRCDFAKDPNGRIAENWVMLDYMDLMAQMGVDLIAQDQARVNGSDPR